MSESSTFGSRSALDRLRGPLERIVSTHLGRSWQVAEARDLSDYACHPCAILAADAFSVFAKFTDAVDGRAQFEVELAGLQDLTRLSGVATPTPLGVFEIEGGCVLVFETVVEVPRAAPQWRDIGRALAQIHRVKDSRFGLARHGTFGPLFQDNTPHDDWPTFFGERRLRPGLRRAVDAGALSETLTRRIESILRRLPDLCGPSVAPTLIHGDAQKNNFISTSGGAVVIDPSIYYGHPEVDLAYVDYFEPVPDDLFDGYRDAQPIDPGFAGRRDLWRLWGYLSAVAIEGGGWYLERLEAAARTYD
ncbi:MAG: fructosamine kinase family protein [Anaerolineales bacterium]|nr:fructosamine kinase family protein [Anaerolineales bacterium]